ncbi:hypothetical protein J2Z40_003806 [Cytobacillus eiseniae]|uniref:Uncharacterized protein n=1 Tax=Cytobacillus eiseniae TaxID=762947 RepID=A0ABS4RKA7_9BACI|nr:hypothetical protein [Cytobacillus eiseniae]MBP2243218.1 hypothetical protein [Cytobacillus eiseniae]
MFWHKKRKEKDSPSLHELKQQLNDLQASVQSLKNQKTEYHFHIDKVDINHPALDQLNFHLDQIDIEELSGALNVGNNFGVSIKDKNGENKHSAEEGKGIKTTKAGYSISLKNKEDKG